MSQALTGSGGEWRLLSFAIGRERCAVELSRVREIARYEAATRVPRVPAAVLGVVNLRGSVLPVVDAAIGLGLPAAPATDRRCLLVVEPVMGGEPTIVGLVADGVDRVLEVAPGDLEPPPAFGTGVPPALVLGLIRHEDGFLAVLDLERLFAEGLFPGSHEPGRAAPGSAPSGPPPGWGPQ